MIYYVYLHKRKDTGEIFYVGKGCGKRAWKKSCRSEWWKRVEAKAGRTVEILAKGLSEQEAFELEQQTIELIGRDVLCNLTAGGLGGISPSEETRQKMSAVHKGKKKSPSTIEKMKAALTGRVPTIETREKIRKSLLGRTGFRHTEETKKRMSEIKSLQRNSAETRAKISKSKTGKKIKPMSDEHKAKISLANTGRKHTEEAKKRMAIASSGVRHSPETIAKMTEKNRATNLKFRKPVKCSNGMVFGYAGEAEVWLRANGFPKAGKSNIASCCHGTLKSAYGFKWQFAETDNSSMIDDHASVQLTGV